jgi:hypothetical protein
MLSRIKDLLFRAQQWGVYIHVEASAFARGGDAAIPPYIKLSCHSVKANIDEVRKREELGELNAGRVIVTRDPIKQYCILHGLNFGEEANARENARSETFIDPLYLE